MTDISNLEDAIYQTDNYISMPEALEIYEHKITKWTMIAWCKKYGIGIKVGGRWKIDPDKLALLLKGQLKAPQIPNPNDRRRKK